MDDPPITHAEADTEDWALAPALPVPPWFIPECEALGIGFDEGEVERLARFLGLLLSANSRFNLTAVRDPDDAWRKHIADSLTLLAVLAELDEGSRVIDVGTGGGLPGVPLAVCRPDLHFTLLDATGKKVRFLERAIAELGLANATALQARAEQAGQDAVHRASYDAVVSRAVGRLAVLAELTVPLAREGGMIVLIKGEKAGEELDEAKQGLHMLHAGHAGTVETPTGRLVVLSKERPTPGAYPRPNGEPKKAPLGVRAGTKGPQP